MAPSPQRAPGRVKLDARSAAAGHGGWLVHALGKGSRFRFVLLFGSLSTTLLGLYYFPYPEGSAVKSWLDAFLRAYAASAGFVLHWFDPRITVVGQDIIGGYSLRIVKTCDAMDVNILLASAIFALPAPLKRRIAFAMVGIVAMYVINVIRICTLYGIGVRFPSFFEAAHLDVWPAVILLFAIGFFWTTSEWGQNASATGQP
jgi:exosortase/archaeosortase family protein